MSRGGACGPVETTLKRQSQDTQRSRICALGVVYVVQCSDCISVYLYMLCSDVCMNVCAEGGHPLVHSFSANMQDHSLLVHNASALESPTNMIQQMLLV